MLCIHIKNTDPFFCLAAEEFLLKNFNDDIFMLWQSDNTVVVGKHQNALSEINFPYVRENNIIVARRISGGGTVFHDKGNVNFAFIKNVQSTQEISFKKFTQPIVNALKTLNVNVKTSGRNDLLVDGKKISGNAEHVFKKRVLHHGTLLFNSDLKNLGEAIKVKEGKYQSKAIQSNRSEVVNISNFLDSAINIQKFIQHLLDSQIESDEGNTPYSFSNEEIIKIQDLAKEKFSTWDWRFGYSPKYSFQNTYTEGDKKMTIKMQVVKGTIQECKIEGNLFSAIINNKVASQLIGGRHKYEDVNNILKLITSKSPVDLTYSFF